VALGCVVVSRLAAQGDVAAGQTVFSQKCASCHSVTPDLGHGLLGPNLVGVLGRTSGTVAGWDFSPALKDAKLVWTEETMGKWLTDSAALVPGAKMDLKVPNRFEREDVVAYLKSLKPKE
jgi:cytochrome c